MAEPGSLPEWGENDFEREVLGFPGRALVMFGEPGWSSPCHYTRRVLERLAPEFPGVLVGLVKMGDSPGLCQRFGVQTMPTLVVFEAGKAVRLLRGMQPDATLREVLGG